MLYEDFTEADATIAHTTENFTRLAYYKHGHWHKWCSAECEQVQCTFGACCAIHEDAMHKDALRALNPQGQHYLNFELSISKLR